MMIKCIALFALVAFSNAYVIPENQYQEDLVVGQYEPQDSPNILEPVRYRRSFAPGAPGISSTTTPYPWNVGAEIDRNGPDTAAKINAGHQTDQTKVVGTWSKVVRGPNRAKPNWSIGVQHRW